MPKRTLIAEYASPADFTACRAALRGGSKTFYAASLVLPPSTRKSATALYAFCRMADDAIDQGHDRAAALAQLRTRLDRIYAGHPAAHATDRVFADCVAKHEIPKEFPAALLEGFEWDAAGRRYQTLSELRSYGVRVAGTVGVMMALVMGVRERWILERACDLGVAMQLTNIARDVGEDARAGRIYLPLDWLQEAGMDPTAWLAKPTFGAALGSVIERLLAAAEDLYARSDAGLARLPMACRPGMFAARRLYAEIGHELARRGFDSVNRRAIVSWQRKSRVLTEAVLAAAVRHAPGERGHALPEARFLVESVAAQVREPRAPVSWRPLEDRVAWLIDLFERLEQRDHPAGRRFSSPHL
jgi:phytoene synthase